MVDVEPPRDVFCDCGCAGELREPPSDAVPAPVLDVLRSCGDDAESRAYLQELGVGVRAGPGTLAAE